MEVVRGEGRKAAVVVRVVARMAAAVVNFIVGVYIF
jgi:hypothetical protein